MGRYTLSSAVAPLFEICGGPQWLNATDQTLSAPVHFSALVSSYSRPFSMYLARLCIQSK